MRFLSGRPGPSRRLFDERRRNYIRMQRKNAWICIRKYVPYLRWQPFTVAQQGALFTTRRVENQIGVHPHVVKLDGARRDHRHVQTKAVITRQPPGFRWLRQPFPRGIQLFQQAMPSQSAKENAGTTPASRDTSLVFSRSPGTTKQLAHLPSVTASKPVKGYI